MQIPRSQLIPWGVALASVALWATSAPALLAHPFLASLNPNSLSSNLYDEDGGPLVVTSSDGTTSIWVNMCDQLTSVLSDDTDDTSENGSNGASDTESSSDTSVTTSADSSDGASATFHLCGPSEEIERALERLIDGRSFSVSLRSGDDGCADLTVRVSGGPVGNGQQQTNLSVSTNQGQINLQVTSKDGATQVHIGDGQ